MIRITHVSYGQAPWELLPEISCAEAEGNITVSEDGKTAVVRVTKITNNPTAMQCSSEKLAQLAEAISHTWDVVNHGYEGHVFHLRHGEQPRPALSVHVPKIL